MSLDDLKRAIETIPANPRFAGEATFHNLLPYEIARADAWRAAFEWHVGLIERHAALVESMSALPDECIAIDREEEEGMTLIREKLK